LPAADFEDAFIGRHAAAWIRERTGEYPWHYFVSFVGPHDPYDPPSVYAERYRSAAMPAAVPEAEEGRPPSMLKKRRGVSDDLIAVARRQYAASMSQLDDEIGRILAAVEERGELERTLIIFTSDHGDMMGDLGMWAKSVPYEASTRVPLIVAGPGIATGRNQALVSLHDCNASICEWAGLLPQEDIDARSFAAVARGEDKELRDWQLIQLRAFRALRSRQELFVAHNDGEGEYYDLAADPGCQRNAYQTLSDERRRTLHRQLRDLTVKGGCCR
jgi:choline-sulfatase